MAADPIEDRIVEIRRQDRRFSRHAYEFVLDSLDHTMETLGKDRLTGEERHIGGPELLQGIRALASRKYGPMAAVVFRHWGVRRSLDFGEVVFNLIDAGLLSRRDEDSRMDFVDNIDFEGVFAAAFREHLESLSAS